MNDERLQPFDADYGLADLIRLMPKARIKGLYDDATGGAWRLLDLDGTELWASGALGADSAAAPVCVDFKPLGHLHVPEAAAAALPALIGWFEMGLVLVLRYRMASVLHLESIHADYAVLQREHEKLTASENALRQLSRSLEERVQEQVVLIERSQRQLYVAERQASVGSLAAGMAHEINNPIGFIRSNLCSAQRYIATLARGMALLEAQAPQLRTACWPGEDLNWLFEDFEAMMGECLSGADRIARIVAAFKDFSNVDRQAIDRVDLGACLRNVVELLREQSPEAVQFELHLQPLVPTFCDVGRLNQVFLSLLQNAVQALSGRGLIRVCAEMKDGQIEIRIEDSGCGMSEEVQRRIFDPFYTTREVGKGTGLGLTVVHDAITTHGGSIAVSSQPGVGSCFTIRLPIRSEAECAHMTVPT